MWTQLAVQRALLPTADCAWLSVTAENIADMGRTFGRAFEFMQSLNADYMQEVAEAGVVLSDSQVHCKYACLFHPAQVFDKLRDSFLLQLCIHGELESLQNLLATTEFASLTEPQQCALRCFARRPW